MGALLKSQPLLSTFMREGVGGGVRKSEKETGVLTHWDRNSIFQYFIFKCTFRTFPNSCRFRLYPVVVSGYKYTIRIRPLAWKWTRVTPWFRLKTRRDSIEKCLLNCVRGKNNSSRWIVFNFITGRKCFAENVYSFYSVGDEQTNITYSLFIYFTTNAFLSRKKSGLNFRQRRRTYLLLILNK